MNNLNIPRSVHCVLGAHRMDPFLAKIHTENSPEYIKTFLLNCFAYINKDVYSFSERKFFNGFHPVIVQKINHFMENNYLRQTREIFNQTFHIHTPLPVETHKQEMLALFMQQTGSASNLIDQDYLLILTDKLTVEDYQTILTSQLAEKIRIQFTGDTSLLPIQIVLEAINKTNNTNIKELKFQGIDITNELLQVLVNWKNKKNININLEYCGLGKQTFPILNQKTENKRFLIGGNDSDLLKKIKKLENFKQKFRLQTEDQIYAIKS